VGYRVDRRPAVAASLFNRIKESNLPPDLVLEYRYEFGLALLECGRFVASVDMFRACARLHDQKPPLFRYRVYFRLGEAYIKTKQFQKARISLRRCLRLCPDHKLARQRLDSISGRASKV
jgi:tetratricopeptide (TPR) repeat protein